MTLTLQKMKRNMKINHDKYIDTQEFNKLAADVLNARIAQAKLIRNISN